MALLKLPFSGPVYQNVDKSALPGEFAAEIHDAIIDEMGSTVKRPGLAEFVDLGLNQPVDGLHWWDEKGMVAAVCGGKVFKLTDAAGTKADLTGDAMGLNRRPTFATEGDNLFMANGGKVTYTNGTANTAYLADVDAPTAVDFADWMDLYLLAAKKGTDQLFYSEINDPTNFDPLNFDVAYSQPDNTVAMGVANGEILLLGKRSAESWVNDGYSPFTRQNSASVSIGCIAPHSLRLIRGIWYFLDHERRLVRLTSRVPEILSTPIEKTFAKYGEVTDCLADFIFIDGQPLLILSFPTEGKTWVYNVARDQWQGEWHYFNPTTNEYERWLGNTYCYAKDWNLHLVGSRKTGKIYRMNSDLYTDAGATIRMARRTGSVNHGIDQEKISNLIRFKFRRGAVTGPASATLRYRDNGSSIWKSERTLNLGALGETEFYVTLRQLGRYRSREYELVMSDNAPFVLVEAWEDVTAVGR